MKNSTKFTLSILVVVLVVYVAYKWQVSSKSEVPSEIENTSAGDEAADEQQSHVEPELAGATPTLTPPTPIEQVDEMLIQQKFAAGLKILGSCFNIQGEVGDKMEPTFQNLNNFIRTDMGEMLSNSELWSNTDIQTPGGERRRIRIEMDYGASESSNRKLKYMMFGPDGQLIPIPLSAEQSENASEAFIASLESDGKVFSRSHALTAYYPNFAEMEFSEKDGRLVSVEMLMGESGKFSCMNMDNNNISCRCHNP